MDLLNHGVITPDAKTDDQESLLRSSMGLMCEVVVFQITESVTGVWAYTM